MASTIDFGLLAKELCQMKGMTQEEFAAALDVTTGTPSSWESGHHRPVNAQRKRLVRLATKVGIQQPRAVSPTTGKEQ